MADLAHFAITAHLDTDSPTVTVGGTDEDFASLRIGGDIDTYMEIFAGTRNRASGLARLSALVSAATEALAAAAGARQ